MHDRCRATNTGNGINSTRRNPSKNRAWFESHTAHGDTLSYLINRVLSVSKATSGRPPSLASRARTATRRSRRRRTRCGHDPGADRGAGGRRYIPPRLEKSGQTGQTSLIGSARSTTTPSKTPITGRHRSQSLDVTPGFKRGRLDSTDPAPCDEYRLASARAAEGTAGRAFSLYVQGQPWQDASRHPNSGKGRRSD